MTKCVFDQSKATEEQCNYTDYVFRVWQGNIIQMKTAELRFSRLVVSLRPWSQELFK